MGVTRRDFFKISGSTLLMGALGAPAPASTGEQEQKLRIEGAAETKTICPYCSVGCGINVYTKDGKVVDTEGDPEHPISEGTLCSKGASLISIVNNPLRVVKPLYRAPGAGDWKEVEWDWALDRVARNIKDTRDRSFKHTSKSRVKEKGPDGKEVESEKEFVVNRTDGIAHVGSAALDNEECYMLQKLLRSWGIAAVEHQARI